MNPTPGLMITSRPNCSLMTTMIQGLEHKKHLWFLLNPLPPLPCQGDAGPVRVTLHMGKHCKPAAHFHMQPVESRDCHRRVLDQKILDQIPFSGLSR